MYCQGWTVLTETDLLSDAAAVFVQKNKQETTESQLAVLITNTDYVCFVHVLLHVTLEERGRVHHEHTKSVK